MDILRTLRNVMHSDTRIGHQASDFVSAIMRVDLREVEADLTGFPSCVLSSTRGLSVWWRWEVVEVHRCSVERGEVKK